MAAPVVHHVDGDDGTLTITITRGRRLAAMARCGGGGRARPAAAMRAAAHTAVPNSEERGEHAAGATASGSGRFPPCWRGK